MPPEPKKPIEELLEASARARRAEFGADPQIPNPVRARLHEEIARVNRGEEPRPRRNWFANFWPQISLATAIALALITGSAIWYRNQAKRDTVSLSMAMKAPNPPNETSSLALDKAKVGAIAESQPNGLTLGDAKIAADSTDAIGGKLSSEVAQAPVLAGAPAATARSFAAQTRKLEMTNQAQRFTRSAPSKNVAQYKTQAKQAANLLNNFNVTQEGDKISVVDEDGSTYTGKLEPLAQNDSRSLAKKNQQPLNRAAAATKPAEQNQSNEYFFRAVGFNESLKKRVVFEANYVPMPETNQPNAADNDRRRDEQTQARIIGTAKIPGEAPVEVDAISVAH